jgi:hypothetical protein
MNELDVLNDKIRLKQTQIAAEQNPQRKQALIKQLERLKIQKQIRELIIKKDQINDSIYKF